VLTDPIRAAFKGFACVVPPTQVLCSTEVSTHTHPLAPCESDFSCVTTFTPTVMRTGTYVHMEVQQNSISTATYGQQNGGNREMRGGCLQVGTYGMALQRSNEVGA